MKGTRLLLLLAIAATSLSAQANRDAYRIPYKTWREVAPDLEREAGAPTPDFSAHVDASAKAAQDYFNARIAFLSAPSDQLRWAQTPFAKQGSVVTPHPEVQRLLSVASDYLTKTIGTFSGVKDPAIQQVRQAMERERAALNALSDSIRARQTALTAVIESTEDADALRAGAAQSLAISNTGRARLAEQLRKESELWGGYYRELIDGALARPPSTPSSGAPSSAATTPVSPAVPATQAKPQPVPRTAGQFPLARYTGEWMFPARGLYYGPQPESISLVVNENNGRLSGTMSARFILSPGNANDPVLKFTFDGPIEQGRSQKLSLKTEAGSTGTIELIPGSAYNLLEVTFETEPGINKIRSGNFVLLKQ